MKKTILFISLIATTFFSFAAKSDYLGIWKSQAAKSGNIATIKIFEANNKLYGNIIGMRR